MYTMNDQIYNACIVLHSSSLGFYQHFHNLFSVKLLSPILAIVVIYKLLAPFWPTIPACRADQDFSQLCLGLVVLLVLTEELASYDRNKYWSGHNEILNVA